MVLQNRTSSSDENRLRTKWVNDHELTLGTVKKGTLATTIGENGPLNEIRELQSTIQQQIPSLVHWLVYIYELRNPKRQCKTQI